MNKQILYISVVVVILAALGGGYWWWSGQNYQPEQVPADNAPTDNAPVQSAYPAPGFEGIDEMIVNDNGAVSDNEPITDNGGAASPDEPVSNPPTVREIRMTSGNMFFNPDTLVLTKGQPVRIIFDNTGVHTFTVDELGVNVALRDSSGVVEFTPQVAGTFEFYCAVPGHREAGMFGSVTVK